MRFCPFCSAENAIEATHCKTCARRLPPLPPRRRKPARSVGVEPRDDYPDRDEAPGNESAQAPGKGPGQAEAGPTRSLLSRMAPSPAALRRTVSARVEPPEPAPAPESAPAPEPALAAGPEIEPAREPAREPEREPARDAERDDDEWPARPEIAADASDWSASASLPAEAPVQPGDAPRIGGYPQATAYPPYSGHPKAVPVLENAPPLQQVGRPDVVPIPEVPEAGAVNAVRYALAVTRARWQRRDVIRSLNEDNHKDAADLDEVLVAVGKQARALGPALGIEQPVLAAENAALDQAEERRRHIDEACAALTRQQAEDNSAFEAVEAEHQAKVAEIEAQLQSAQNELGSLHAQQRGLRDKHKTLERQYRGYLKAAEERDQQASQAAMGEARAGLRQGAEDMRREAQALEPELHDVDSRMAALERPISQAMARVEALHSQLDAQRRHHEDAREGHRYRLAEIDAELSKKSLELSQAEAEIQRRLLALGTLVDLHRPRDRPDNAELADLYGRIDSLRGAMAARTAEINRLTAESEAYDRASRSRGFLILGGGLAVLVLVIIIVAALL